MGTMACGGWSNEGGNIRLHVIQFLPLWFLLQFGFNKLIIIIIMHDTVTKV